MESHAFMTSPVGAIRVTEESGRITRLDWAARIPDGAGAAESGTLAQAVEELKAYFEGRLRRFSVPLGPKCSVFQHIFNEALFSVKYGETRTYGELAEAIGVTPQAIGQACAANPIPIIIPCHRVLAATGLGGYSGSGGVATKAKLLKMEGAAALLL